MLPKIKNIIIFASVAIIFIFVYIFFLRKEPEEASLIPADNSALTADNTNVSINIGDQNTLTQNFLTLLLGVQSIKLDDSIFRNGSNFFTLRDSSILLVPDGTEGRVNPFAPIGSDAVSSPPLSSSLEDISSIDSFLDETDLNLN